MAAQFKITDGTTSVDLLGTGVPIRYDGLPGLGMDVDISFTKSGLGGGGVSGFSFPPVVRTYKLMVKGSSHDDAATQVQTLFRLLRKAALYHSDPRYLTPVYIVQQTSNETSPRYALVYGFQGFNVSSPFEIPFRNQSVLTEIGIPIIQDAFWQPTIPGTLPAEKMEWYPVWEKEVHTTADTTTITSGTGTVTDEGEWIKCSIAAGPDVAFIRESLPGSGKAIVVRFKVDLSALTMNNGDSFVLSLLGSQSVGGTTWAAYTAIDKDSGQIKARTVCYDDSGTPQIGSAAAVDVLRTLDFLWIVKVATDAGANDGGAWLYESGNLLSSVENIDNDQRILQGNMPIGFHTATDAGTSGTIGLSRVAWTIGYDSLPTRVYVTNYETDNNVPDHIYVYDASGPSSTELVPGAALFPSPVGNGDALEFHTPYPPFCIVIPKLSAAGSLDTSELKLQIWTGAWTNPALGVDYTCYPGPTLKDCFEQADEDIIIAFRGNSSATTVGGSYIIRIAETHAAPSWSAIPVSNRTRRPELLDSAHIDIPSWALNGDAPAKLLLRLFAPTGATSWVGAFGHTSRILIGAKSRGLHHFRHILPLGDGGQFAGWTISYGTDTSSVADALYPAGVYAKTTFATDESTVMRVRLVGDNMLRYYRGAYRLFLILHQAGGSAGDVTLKARIGLQGTSDHSPKWDTPEKTTVGVIKYEVVDLGTINIPFGPETAIDEHDIDLILEVHAGVASGTGGAVDLILYALVLMPIDEWSVELDDPVTNTDYGTSALRGDKVLEIDGGIVKDRTLTMHYDRSIGLIPLETWSRRGAPPELEPGQETRLCFLILCYSKGWLVPPLINRFGLSFGVEAYAVPRYAALIGDGSS